MCGVIGNWCFYVYNVLSMWIYSWKVWKIVSWEYDLCSLLFLDVNWEGSWNDYLVFDRKKILVEFDVMIKVGMWVLFVKVGLMELVIEVEEK